MEYKIFINKIYIKNAWMSKEELSMNLFLSAVNNKSSITEKRNSSNSFKGYNRGNSIAEIAGDVIRDLNQNGIETFLKNTFDGTTDKKAEYVQIICEKFKDDIPDITAENICKKIAAFFIDEVLRPAVKANKKEDATTPHPLNSAQSQEGEPTTAVDDTTEQNNDSLNNTNHTENYYDNHTDNYNENTTNINETSLSSVTNNTTHVNDNRTNIITITISEKNTNELAELKALINELNEGFMVLEDKGIALYSPFAHITDEEQNKKEQEFESLRTDFILKNKKLRRYYLSFPELRNVFEEMLSLSATMTFEVGFTSNAQNQAIAFRIEKYGKCITEIWEILTKLC